MTRRPLTSQAINRWAEEMRKRQEKMKEHQEVLKPELLRQVRLLRRWIAESKSTEFRYLVINYPKRPQRTPLHLVNDILKLVKQL